MEAEVEAEDEEEAEAAVAEEAEEEVAGEVELGTCAEAAAAAAAAAAESRDCFLRIDSRRGSILARSVCDLHLVRHNWYCAMESSQRDVLANKAPSDYTTHKTTQTADAQSDTKKLCALYKCEAKALGTEKPRDQSGRITQHALASRSASV